MKTNGGNGSFGLQAALTLGSIPTSPLAAGPGRDGRLDLNCLKSNRAVPFITAALALTLPLAGATAADILWTNASNGNWSVAANWSPNQVPGTNDTAWITNNGTYTVTLNANAILGGLVLGGTSGTQTLSHATYTLTLNGPGSSSPNGVYSLASGTLTGTGALLCGGRFNWSGGFLGSSGSSLVVTANGGLTMSGAGKVLHATLINNGAATWTAGSVGFYPGGVLSNAASVTLDFTADNQAFTLQSGSASLVNAGLLRKTSGTGTTTIAPPCTNTGVIQANMGAINVIVNGRRCRPSSEPSVLPPELDNTHQTRTQQTTSTGKCLCMQN